MNGLADGYIRPVVYLGDGEMGLFPGNNPVRVRLERKGRKGKSVSVIEGVLSPPLGKEALLKYLKSKLGTGGAVKGDDLEIQGDQRDRIVELLVELGYKTKKAGG